MPMSFKRNAVIASLLAVFFYWSFMYAKHNPALRPVIPFGDDPYDAVGSFASIAGILLALLSAVRAFRPYRNDPPSDAQRVLLVRSQQAVVLAVFITLVSDLVAMARHPQAWTAPASLTTLAALLAGLAIGAGVVQALIRASLRELPNTRPASWKPAAAVSLLAILVLLFYPEEWIGHFLLHLLTILIGALVLFASMGLLLPVLVPYPNERAFKTKPNHSGFSRPWILALLLGLLVGVVAFLGEITEGTSVASVGRLLFVASVFIGLALAGFSIAFAFLGKPLGLHSRSIAG